MPSDFRQICRWFIGEREPGVHFEEPVTDFIEIVTFTDADEIVAVLEEVLAEDWGRLPVWARNLAFRLAVLQRPHDADLLHTAGADLRCWGPTWHHLADEMVRRAGAMKEEQARQRQEPNPMANHDTWVRTLGRVADLRGDPGSLPCPDCSRDRLAVRYVVDPGTRIGYGLLWCDACLHGISLSRLRAPDGAAIRSIHDPAATEGVPDFIRRAR
ncbi:hypothetical protein [Kitasatospora sp. NPDC004289]